MTLRRKKPQFNTGSRRETLVNLVAHHNDESDAGHRRQQHHERVSGPSWWIPKDISALGAIAPPRQSWLKQIEAGR